MKKIISLLLFITIFSLIPIVHAAFDLTPPGGVGVSDVTKVPGTSAEKLVETIVTNVLNIFFTVGGLGAVIYFVWGAVDWIISGGDKEKVAGARKKITTALVGLTLLALSFVIINWIGLIIGFNPLGNLQLRDLGTN